MLGFGQTVGAESFLFSWLRKQLIDNLSSDRFFFHIIANRIIPSLDQGETPDFRYIFPISCVSITHSYYLRILSKKAFTMAQEKEYLETMEFYSKVIEDIEDVTTKLIPLFISG